MLTIRSLFIATLFSAGAPASAESTRIAATLDPLVIYGRSLSLVGEADSATEGFVGAAELAARPFLRRGELLEVVPGVVVTQHSGSGKANQYFLRGFNLDHGTDFSVAVDGMPVNLRTHGHGQGYADLNFIVPEFVEGIAYQKGTYFAASGDFATAGAAQFKLVDALARGFVKVEGGEDQFMRIVSAETFRTNHSATTIGLEASYHDGPWDSPENSRRFNGFARHTWTKGESEFALTALGYHGEWDSTDQIPQRAIETGVIGRFGAVDPTDGGKSDRTSLSFDWRRTGPDSSSAVNVYGIRYHVDLYSNFTYFMDDPVNGDQFNQRDERDVFGGEFTHAWNSEIGARKADHKVGLQFRADLIDVGLHRTAARSRLSTVRADEVQEASAAIFAETTVSVNKWLHVQPGVRADAYAFDVESDLDANSGAASAAIVSPKLNVVFGPWKKTEIYVNGGYGFHSNDARGATIRMDPVDGVTPAVRVDPLARARGAEIGVRAAGIPGLVSTFSFWALELDSELVFVGDAGATEATGKTRRAGVEWANFYRVNEWMAFDADLSLTNARFTEDAGEAENSGRHIPGSVGTVLTGGVMIDLPHGAFGSLRMRYFGPQPLIEDDSIRGQSSVTVNANMGWRSRDWEVSLSILNLLGRRNNDIVYYYESQLRGETEPVADVHLHPAEPTTFRLAVTRMF